MAKTKVYGLTVSLPMTWPVEPSANGNRQRLVAVATTSVAKAIEAFNAAGLRVTASTFRTYGYPDMRISGAEAALANPGAIYWSPQDRAGGSPLEPAPVKAQA